MSKVLLQLLNKLNSVQTVTMQEKIVKQDGLSAMYATIEKAYPDFKYEYKAGKGFVEIKNKKQ